jgi:hypothetical protein
MVKQEGAVVNLKKLCWLYRKEGLTVRKRPSWDIAAQCPAGQRAGESVPLEPAPQWHRAASEPEIPFGE